MKNNNLELFKGKNILLTGRTGFKGSWLTLWLTELGANVIGHSLEPPTNPSLFEALNLRERMTHIIGDVRFLVEPMTRQRWMAMGSRMGGSGSAKSADGSRRVYRAVKRVFDVVGALAALIIVDPVLGLVAVIIVSQSSGHGGYANTCG